MHGSKVLPIVPNSFANILALATVATHVPLFSTERENEMDPATSVST